MKTVLAQYNKQAVYDAAEYIRQGEVVAFPTETVYGLGADAYNQAAVAKIFSAKGRPSDNPLIVHFADKSEIGAAVTEIPGDALKLMDAFMPGALTLVLKKNKRVPDNVTCGLDTVAVRVPDSEIAREFIRACGCPVAAPSANLSGRPSPTKASHVFEDMDGRIPYIIDGGETKIGLESTVLDCSGDKVRLLRPGGVAKREIEKVLGYKLIEGHSDEKPLSPGMKYKHYSPKSEVLLFAGEGASGRICAKYDEVEAKGMSAVILCLEGNTGQYAPRRTISMGKDLIDAQHNIFALFRENEYNDIIIVEGIEHEDGDALFNRLVKAGGGRVL